MKILFGVQATGNGHITRARAMNAELSRRDDLEVDYVFSGRKPEELFDMEEFGQFRCYEGVTFVTEAGAIKFFETAQKNSLRQLYKDIKNLDLSSYDLVITDFEPITGWAAKLQKKPSIAIGHQNAFDFAIPKTGSNPIIQLFMNNFSPAKVRLGLHWHHFGQPILPPIADTTHTAGKSEQNKILVYLGFEEPDQVVEWLTPFTNYEFYFYAPFKEKEDRGHLHLRPLSRDGFKQDLATCNGVISNAGFELASEAIHLGKKMLVKPLKGQMEQLSNGLALEILGLGLQMQTLDSTILQNWLENFESKQVIYPDVPKAIVDWILETDMSSPEALSKALWDQVTSPDIPNFSGLTF